MARIKLYTSNNDKWLLQRKCKKLLKRYGNYVEHYDVSTSAGIKEAREDGIHETPALVLVENNNSKWLYPGKVPDNSTLEQFIRVFYTGDCIGSQERIESLDQFVITNGVS